MMETFDYMTRHDIITIGKLLPKWRYDVIIRLSLCNMETGRNDFFKIR